MLNCVCFFPPEKGAKCVEAMVGSTALRGCADCNMGIEMSYFIWLQWPQKQLLVFI